MGFSYEYDEATDTYVTWCDWDVSSPSASIIELIGQVDGRAETEIEPLFESIDPDGLEAMLGQGRDARDDVEISFRHEGFRVTVHGDGYLALRPEGGNQRHPVC